MRVVACAARSAATVLVALLSPTWRNAQPGGCLPLRAGTASLATLSAAFPNLLVDVLIQRSTGCDAARSRAILLPPAGMSARCLFASTAVEGEC